jgi:hypothetical protein
MISGNQARGPRRDAANAARRENPRAERNHINSGAQRALDSCNALLGGFERERGSSAWVGATACDGIVPEDSLRTRDAPMPGFITRRLLGAAE